MTVTSIAHHGLRAWAKGSYPLEAAAELLVRAFGGRFANPGNGSKTQTAPGHGSTPPP